MTCQDSRDSKIQSLYSDYSRSAHSSYYLPSALNETYRNQDSDIQTLDDDDDVLERMSKKNGSFPESMRSGSMIRGWWHVPVMIRFRARYGFLICWSILQMLGFLGFYVYYATSPAFSDMRFKLGASFPIARGAAGILNIDSAMILLPVCKQLLSWLRSMRFMRRWFPFDLMPALHRALGISIFILTWVHIFAHIANGIHFDIIDPTFHVVPFIFLSGPGFTGFGCLIALLLITIPAMMMRRFPNKIRFELFAYTHVFYWIYFGFLLAHGAFCFIKTDTGQCNGPTSWQYIIGPLILLIWDRWSTIIWPLKEIAKIKGVLKHPENVLEIRFTLDSWKRNGVWQYKPGQHVMIMCPDISLFQWHSFTISSTPEDPYISVHMACRGDWTKALIRRYQHVEENMKLNKQLGHSTKSMINLSPRLIVSGPYNTNVSELRDFDTVVMIAAGIGVTPFISVLRHLWYRHHHPSSTTSKIPKKVYFIWVCRNLDSFSWFRELLDAMERDKSTSSWLEIQLFWTAKQLPLTNVQKIYNNAIYFDLSDPITNLQTRTNFGRPNWSKLLSQIAHHHPGENIGTFTCGPMELTRQLKRHCYQFDGHATQTRFLFHQERF